MKKFHAALLPLFAAAALLAGACVAPAPPGDSNLRPSAVSAATPTSGQAPLLVQFSSVGSADPDGFIESYSWDFGDGSAASLAQNPVHTYIVGGPFTATLTVTDDGGATATSTVLLSVTPPANYPPAAVLGATPTSGKGPLVVNFDSAGSTDVDGTITSVEWDFGDSSPNSSNAATTHTYNAVGTYVASLTVTDDDGDANTDTVDISVVANVAPVAAAAGTPSSGKAPLVVAFTSAGSDDADGTITSYSWDFGDSSPPDPTEAPFHTYAAAGVYTATLTVTDDSGDSDTATVVTTVNANQAPTAIANGSPDAGKAPLGVVFSSAGSVDNDGTIVSYSWNFGDASPISTAANPSHLYAAQGVYTSTLTVTDDDGATATAGVVVNVGPPNVVPTVAAVATPAFGKVPLAVNFSSAGTIDPDGSIVSYAWNFGDASLTSNAINPSHTYSSVGSFTATLTVTDDDGATATLPVSVDVLANVAPTAVGSATPDTGKEPLEVTFSSAASTDPDGTIASYAWNFGDSSAVDTSANPTHTYVLPGSYVATLTVTDDSGDSDSTTVNVTVNPNQAPTAVANATSTTTGNAPLTVTFDSSVSSDPDGIFSVSWDFGDGTAASTAVAPSHLFVAAGTYTVTLTVTDDNGAVSTATVSVTAEDLTLWVRDGGNDSGSGSTAVPFDSIGAALAAAVTRSKTDVRVAGGSYTGFAVVDGIDVTGGYDQSFVPGGVDGATEAVVTGAPGSPGVTASAISSVTILKGLSITGGGGANATGVLVQNSSVITLDTVKVNSGTATGAGSSAYGVRSLSGSAVTVLGSQITAQGGVQGASGGTGTNGSGGANGIASTGNPLVGVPPGGVSAGGSGLSRSGRGADGSQNLLFQTVDGKVGEKGGVVGTPDGGGLGGIAGVNALWGGGGGGGGTTNGAAGAAGAGGAATPGAAGDTYVGVVAGTGGASGVGAGGGGGGSGRANATRSGAGGSGGVGGGGAQGGLGALAGGGSFALYSNNATITVDNCVLTTGLGGKGGTGGTGGTGGAGGAGGPGLNTGGVGGGGGGGGAAGGRGGSGGGGGAGGPSIAAYHSGTGTLATTSVTAGLGGGGAAGNNGAGGSGGTGGAGGVRGTSSDGTRNGFAGGPGSTGQSGATGSAGGIGTAFTSWDNGVTA